MKKLEYLRSKSKKLNAYFEREDVKNSGDIWSIPADRAIGKIVELLYEGNESAGSHILYYVKRNLRSEKNFSISFLETLIKIWASKGTDYKSDWNVLQFLLLTSALKPKYEVSFGGTEIQTILSQPFVTFTESISQITINENGDMTFAPKGKKMIQSTPWKKDGRQSGKFGKVLRNVLKAYGLDSLIKDSELEYVVNQIKAIYTVDGSIEEVSGDDIAKYYRHTFYDYSSDLGTLDGSCMRYEDDTYEEAKRLYTENSQVSMVIIRNEEIDKIKARAILWTDIEGDKYLDRVYGSDAASVTLKNYAKSKGYWIRSHQGSGDACFKRGDEVKEDVFIHLDYTNFTYYPYIDTLYNVDEEGVGSRDACSANVYYAQEEPSSQADYIYCELEDVSVHGEDCVWSDYHEANITTNNAIYSDALDDWFYNPDCVPVVVDDEENKEYIPEDHNSITELHESNTYALESICTYSEHYNSYILDHESVHSDYHDSYILEDESVYVEELNDYVISGEEEEALTSQGFVQCAYNDKWYKLDECKYYEELDEYVYVNNVDSYELQTT